MTNRVLFIVLAVLFLFGGVRLRAQQAQHQYTTSYDDSVVAKVYLISVDPATNGLAGYFNVRAGFVCEGKFTPQSQNTWLGGYNAYVLVVDNTMMVGSFQPTRTQTKYTTARTIENVPFALDAGTGKRVANLILDRAGVYTTVQIFGDGMYKIVVSLTNNDAVGTEYIIKQGNNELGRVYLGPGESRIAKFTTSSDQPATVLNQPYGGYQVDGGWNIQPIGNPSPIGSPINPAPSGGTDTPVPITPNAAGSGSTGTTSGPGQKTGDVVWKSGDGQSLDASTFKQGVETITKAIAANSGGGGGATDMSGVHSRLDTANSKLTDLNGKLETTTPTAHEFDSETDVVTPFASTGPLGILNKLPSAPNITAPGMADPNFQVTLPLIGGQSATFVVNFTQFAGPISVVRTIIGGLCSIGFFLLVLRTLKEAFA
jgi:hypothetical protein